MGIAKIVKIPQLQIVFSIFLSFSTDKLAGQFPTLQSLALFDEKKIHSFSTGPETRRHPLAAGSLQVDEKICSFAVGRAIETEMNKIIHHLLKGSGKTLSVAESCTGGRISHLVTRNSGSSGYYLGGVCSYSVGVKEKVLGVSPETVDRFGIVSPEVAAAMAEGVRALTGSTFSVATTGWADRFGDEREPAGTVWIAVSGPDGTRTKRFENHGTRLQNIRAFTDAALQFLALYIG